MQLTAAEIERLSPEEPLRPIEQLWDSLADAEVPLPPAQDGPLPDALVALACFHARRDPRRWQERG